MNKRALFIVNSLNNGGAERVCANMANAYLSNGDAVDFVILSAKKNDNKYKIADGKINIISLGYDFSKKRDKIRCILFGGMRLSKYIKKMSSLERYDLITSHLPMSNIVSRFSIVGKKAIYVLHSNMTTFSKNKTKLIKPFVRLFFRKRKVVCVSEGIEEECINVYRFSKEYTKRIYNPINIDDIKKKSKEKLDYGSDRQFFIVVGRLNKLKRQDRCIEIFEKGGFGKKYDLVICGTGETEQELREMAKRTSFPDSIKFVGWQENVYKWIKKSTILLCTSDAEGFPMNLVEAFVCGAKVVSSNCDFGPKEILTGEYSKFLVKKNDIDGYICAIKKALKGYPDANNEIINECAESNVISKYEKFYKENIK